MGIFFVGGGGRGLTNERPGTDHVISGPMRGLEKNCTQWRRKTNRHTDTQTHGHGDSMTESAKWGRFSKIYLKKIMNFGTKFFISMSPRGIHKQ